MSNKKIYLVLLLASSNGLPMAFAHEMQQDRFQEALFKNAKALFKNAKDMAGLQLTDKQKHNWNALVKQLQSTVNQLIELDNEIATKTPYAYKKRETNIPTELLHIKLNVGKQEITNLYDKWIKSTYGMTPRLQRVKPTHRRKRRQLVRLCKQVRPQTEQVRAQEMLHEQELLDEQADQDDD